MTYQFLQGQRQTQAAEERSQRARERRAWDRVDELNEECEELGEEVRSLRDQLARSKAFIRLLLIQKKGLIKVINYLKRAWDPRNPAERGLKEDINPLFHSEIEKIQSDAECMRQIEQEIEDRTAPAPPSR